ncbi:rossmann fold nucleotide-binding protein [Candidatus Scalindua japonica]|uniref:AMP nucleosidase n=1 Tax=Candidatus Scalindua japonica TaxID=1284222 RepID=A0A286TVF6_9BACT|nr:TIGR00730 family Rossman fold protein [Candidatus Scalindua japonica]GAX59834.1 rossmann fold nucleotide-binding protein [Candidatus Scalindua japonica]
MNGEKKEYKTGREDLDEIIADLAIASHSGSNINLIEEMLTTVIKLGLENDDRGDLKLINMALKELRYASKVFRPYRDKRKVVIFGSARARNDSDEYKMTVKLSELIVKKGFKVITGGGPGIMEAGNKGAGREESFSLNIKLPFEQMYNPYSDGDKKAVSFKYFFNRKLFFLKESDATVILPGGFGTLDECFETITLVQTGKSKPRPIILIDHIHSQYWNRMMDFVTRELYERGFVSRNDLSLLIRVNTIEQAVDKLLKFYRVYHSIRYVGDKTVIRLNMPLSREKVNKLNQKYSDILRSGEIEPTAPLPAELKTEEFLDLPRLVMDFDRHSFGTFHEMLWFLNKL